MIELNAANFHARLQSVFSADQREIVDVRVSVAHADLELIAGKSCETSESGDAGDGDRVGKVGHSLIDRVDIAAIETELQFVYQSRRENMDRLQFTVNGPGCDLLSILQIAPTLNERQIAEGGIEVEAQVGRVGSRKAVVQPQHGGIFMIQLMP